MPNPTNSEQVEAVDHRQCAENALDSIGGVRENGSLELAPIAQAHATLALVDEVAKANQDRREHRASAVEELRRLVAEALDGNPCSTEWRSRARVTLAQFEAADHA